MVVYNNILGLIALAGVLGKAGIHQMYQLIYLIMKMLGFVFVLKFPVFI